MIFLTARDLEDEVVAGFDMGADDYITKPFSMKILAETGGGCPAKRRSGRAAKRSVGG